MKSRMSMNGWAVTAAFVLLALVLATGCEGPPERVNAPPQGQSDMPSELQDNYVRMVDNALLNERSMSPVHFVPGSAELNSLGARRLKRYAALLKVYGGALNYDGVEDSKELQEQRLYQIKQYLVSEGVGPDYVAVNMGSAGGRGARATESDEVRKGLTPTAQSVQLSQTRIITDKD